MLAIRKYYGLAIKESQGFGNRNRAVLPGAGISVGVCAEIFGAWEGHNRNCPIEAKNRA
jgi:hypothetical protein